MADATSLQQLCNAVNRRYLSDSLPKNYTIFDAKWWLNRVVKGDGKDGLWRAIVVDGQLIGSISLERKSGNFRIDSELGLMLLDEYSNRGIATFAVGQICREAFATLDIHRITACVFSPNEASQRVLLKNDFRLEGTLHAAAIKDGNIYDVCIYGSVKCYVET